MKYLQKKLRIVALTLVSSLLTLFAQAQEYAITGKVIAGGVEVPGAVVLLSGFQANAITNESGLFSIPKLKPGKYDVIVRMLGFDPTSQSVEIINKDIYLEFVLKENAQILNEVVIKPDDNRDYNMNIFTQNFLGHSPNGKLCTILNPDVIQFSFDYRNRILYASATDMIQIENKALGYKISYLLKEFEANFAANTIFFAGLPHFTPIKARPAQVNNFVKNRTKAYLGSANHFFSTVYKGTTEAEGYHVYLRKQVDNPDRQPEDLIEAKIQQFSNHAFAKTKSTVFSAADSLLYWRKEKQKPKKIQFLDTTKVNMASLARRFNSDLKEINFSHDLLVLYQNESEVNTLSYLQMKLTRPPKYKNSQASAVKLLHNAIKFYSNGLLFDPRSALFEGYWSFEKLGDLVPLDEEFKIENLK